MRITGAMPPRFFGQLNWRFHAVKLANLVRIVAFSSPASSGQSPGFSENKLPAGQYQVRETEWRKQLCNVFRQAAIARIPITKKVLYGKITFTAYARSGGPVPDRRSSPFQSAPSDRHSRIACAKAGACRPMQTSVSACPKRTCTA